MESRATPSENGDNSVVAYFESQSDVRAAVLELEAAGVDAVHVDQSGADPQRSGNRIDGEVASTMRQRSASGAAIGAVAAGVVGALVGWLLSFPMAAGLALVVGAAILGGWAGAFYGVATKLPMNAQAADEGLVDPPDGVFWLAVGGPSDVRDSALEVFDRIEPTSVVRC